MPMQRERYPDDWPAIALSVKNDANWTCEHCGKPCRKPGVSWYDFHSWLLNESGQEHWGIVAEDEVVDEESGEVGYVPKPKRFTLTVAHLDHTPSNCDRANLKALCSVCHLKYDGSHHATSRKRNQRLKLEAAGQLTLF